MQAVLQVVDKIPTIATQLKIIAAVKATRQGGNGKWREGEKKKKEVEWEEEGRGGVKKKGRRERRKREGEM